MERFDTVVVGAGAGGLAAGWHLRHTGRRYVILEAADRVGDSWRHRYDSLRLFTPARYCALPGAPLPLEDLTHPAKDDVAEYLEKYASDLPVRLGHRVTRHHVVNGRHRLDDGLEADRLIMATGAYRRPVVPPFAGRLDPAIRQLHSDRYRRPSDLLPGPVLVVGAGTAGADIALDVAGRHETWLSGPRTGRVPLNIVRSATARRLYGLPVPELMRRRLLTRGSPLVWQTEAQLTRAGVRRVGRTIGTRDGSVLVAGAKVLSVANVIWCTGYRPDFGWLTADAIRPDGWPHHRRGVSTVVPGLGFVGLPFQRTFASGFLAGMDGDAAVVVGHFLGHGMERLSR
jgi:putative flavoprotein involved in K+ transport